MDEEDVSPEAAEAAAEVEEMIEELVDIEEYVLAGRPVPKARRYRFRVNKTHCVSDTPELTGAQILEKAGLTPVSQYRLSEKKRHGPPVEIALNQTVDLRAHGIERFIAQHCEVQDGLDGDRREFALSDEDSAFLDGLGWRWEAIKNDADLWVIIYGVAVPPGYTVSSVDVAIQIMPGYPTSQLDMAYFHPALQRKDGKVIPNSNSSVSLDSKNWQRWSRHRQGASAWVPGVDNLERHFAYMQSWLVRETAR